MSILKALQDYLAAYPDIRPVRILTDGVSEDAESYAVSPAGNIRISEDILGNRTYENDYVFLARECTADEVERQDNYDFLEGLFEWLEGGALPELPGSYRAERLTPSNVILLDIGQDGTGICQVQLKLIFTIRRNAGWLEPKSCAASWQFFSTLPPTRRRRCGP